MSPCMIFNPGNREQVKTRWTEHPGLGCIENGYEGSLEERVWQGMIYRI